VSSTPELTLSIDENAAAGTVVGSVDGTDAEREALIASLLAGDPHLVYSAETGKFYKTVDTAQTWLDAQAGAVGTTLEGVSGQLVTIQSAAEHDFMNNLRATTFGTAWIWLGAADSDVEGTWRWYDGSTAGDAFWMGEIAGSSVDGAYQNWSVNDPNDNGPGEDVAVMTDGGVWADNRDSAFMRSIIEWNAEEVLDCTNSLTYSIQSQAVASAFATCGAFQFIAPHSPPRAPKSPDTLTTGSGVRA